MVVEIVKGFFCEPDTIAVVKATGKKECAVFTQGQSAMDGGFHLPHSARRVAYAINNAIMDWDEDGDEDGDEDEEASLDEDEEEGDD